jgi:hypothetical protein
MEKRKFFTAPGVELRPLGHSAIPTALSRFIKVKLSLKQAVKPDRGVRSRGSHVF